MSASAAPDRSWSARPKRSPTTIEAWFEQTDVDGLNVPFAVSPGDFEDIADMLVPELTRRGRYKSAYAEGTLREKLFGAGPRAADGAASGERSIGRVCGRRRRSRCADLSTVIASVRRSNPYFLCRTMDCFAAPRNDDETQFTELFTTTSISLAPGRLNADDSTDFNWPGSVTCVASSPSDLATPVKSTGGSTKSMPT